MISKFVFQSRNCNQALRFGDKIQNSTLEKKIKTYNFFNFYFNFRLKIKRHFPYTHSNQL